CGTFQSATSPVSPRGWSSSGSGSGSGRIRGAPSAALRSDAVLPAAALPDAGLTDAGRADAALPEDALPEDAFRRAIRPAASFSVAPSGSGDGPVLSEGPAGAGRCRGGRVASS